MFSYQQFQVLFIIIQRRISLNNVGFRAFGLFRFSLRDMMQNLTTYASIRMVIREKFKIEL